MNLLLQRFIEICLLKAGPQDLPSSGFLLILALLCYGLVGIGLSLNQATFATSLLMVLVDVMLLALMTYLLLWLRLLPQRFLQTLTALAGTGALLALAAWPLLLWQQQSAVGLASLLLWLWFFWNLMVFGHIIRHALTTRLTIGVVMALLYMYLSFNVSRALFGPVDS